MRVRQIKDMEEAEQQIYEENSISQFFFDDWLNKYQGD